MTRRTAPHNHTRRLAFLTLAAVVVLAPIFAPGAGAQNSKPAAAPPKIEGAATHPTVFVTPADIARARDNIKRFDWAKQTADAVLREADAWLAKDDAWLRSAVPAPGAAFAYGIVACPVCGANWGPFGREGGSFANPGHVTCSNGHTMPDADHPDSGTGYVAPDRRIHYFVGAYNAWAVETLTFKALENLVYAYSITGDEKYAVKAAVILDALAAVYPADHKGAWDYPSNPPSGRLDRPWYQASRVLVHYVDQYDQLFNSPALDRPSVAPGLTRHENIERNMLLDGGAYCYEQSKAGGLNNGEADYERGALAVGVCLGIPEYVRWAADGPYGIRTLLANDIDRDGGYYETTPMYADHTRELDWTFAEPLLNYRGTAFPAGFDIYRDPKFQLFLLPHNLPMEAAGHLPRFGDAPPDPRKRNVPARPFDRSDYDFLEKLYGRTTDAAVKEQAAVLLNWLAAGDIESKRRLESTGDPSGLTIPDRRMSAGFSMYREPGDPLGGAFTERMWLLFHAGEAPKAEAGLSAKWQRRLLGSDFLGQKGLVMLRAGEGDDAQGLFLRYGPSLNHGHYDDLNINYLARGYDVTYDMGYGRSAATQTQSNWARQTVSHNVVVVDEASQIETGETGGSLELLADSPLVRVVEASSNRCYAKEGVSQYRRLAALIGGAAGAEDGGYVLDIFRVRGGREHDYVFHALGDEVRVDGLTLGAVEPGSLAGPNINWSAAQLDDGDLAGHPNDWTWVAPPGNGYGFLAGPRRGAADASWTAEWTLGAGANVKFVEGAKPDAAAASTAMGDANPPRLRLVMAANAGTEVIAARANGLYPHYPKSAYVLARRKGEDLRSEFIAAVEPYGAAPQVLTVERLPLEPAAGEVAPVGVKVTRRDGTVDFIFSAGDDTLRRTPDGITLAGRFVHARTRDGKLEGLTLAGVKGFSGFGTSWKPEAAVDQGKITAVDVEKNVVTTAAALPADGSLDGAVIYFSNPGYTRNTAYRILKVERAGTGSRVFLHATVGLGFGRVEAVPDARTLTSSVPHEYANSVRRSPGWGTAVARSTGSGFFDGKRLRTASGAATRLVSVRFGNPMTLIVESAAGFKPGDAFYYDDIQAGDSFDIPLVTFFRE
jgi:Heparinase II/III-like protein